MTWGAAPGATFYRFSWRLAGSSTNFTKDVAATVRSYNITGLSPGRTYSFRVQPFKGAEAGAFTVTLNRVPKPYVLAKVAKPTLTALAGRKVRATWPAVAKASRYEIWRRPAGGTWKKVGDSASRTYTSGKLVAGKTYEFRVRGCDGLAPGPYSSIAKIKVK